MDAAASASGRDLRAGGQSMPQADPGATFLDGDPGSWQSRAHDSHRRRACGGTLAVIGHLPDMTDVAVRDATALEATVRRAAAGDEAAFARLVAEHHASMTRVAFVIVGDAAAASDAVQTAWSIAWQRLRWPARPRPGPRLARGDRRERGTPGRFVVACRRPVVDLTAALDRHGDGDPADAHRPRRSRARSSAPLARRSHADRAPLRRRAGLDRDRRPARWIGVRHPVTTRSPSRPPQDGPRP